MPLPRRVFDWNDTVATFAESLQGILLGRINFFRRARTAAAIANNDADKVLKPREAGSRRKDYLSRLTGTGFSSGRSLRPSVSHQTSIAGPKHSATPMGIVNSLQKISINLKADSLCSA